MWSSENSFHSVLALTLLSSASPGKVYLMSHSLLTLLSSAYRASPGKVPGAAGAATAPSPEPEPSPRQRGVESNVRYVFVRSSAFHMERVWGQSWISLKN